MQRAFFGLLCSMTLLANASSSSARATTALQRMFIPMPASNLPTSGEWVAGDSRLVYIVSDPLMGPPNDPNKGSYFRDFRARFFLVNLSRGGRHLKGSKPYEFLTGPTGMTIGLGSVLGGWLVYEAYDSYNPRGPWRIIARNIVTGRQVLLDSRDREGIPSLTPPPRSDGRTAIWQSWTRVRGSVTSVIRTYNFATGQRRVLLLGGAPTTWAYTGVAISGRRVIVEKDSFARRRAQILLADLVTGRIRPLTNAAQSNSEPWIEGDTAVWKVGWLFSNGRGITVLNVRTGFSRTIAGFNSEAPEIAAGRYVVFSSGGRTRVKLYDIRTGSLQVLAPRQDGYGVGNAVRAAGHVILYDEGKPCGDPNFVCPGRLVVTRVP